MTDEGLDELTEHIARYLSRPNTAAVVISYDDYTGYGSCVVIRCIVFDKIASSGRMLYRVPQLIIEIANANLLDDYIRVMGTENVCVFRP